MKIDRATRENPRRAIARSRADAPSLELASARARTRSFSVIASMDKLAQCGIIGYSRLQAADNCVNNSELIIFVDIVC